MPSPFPINPAVIPMVRTRKALLILDLQNDFVSPDGALYTEEPDGYVERILEVAKIFRDSGAGDVIWVRSEFERHCPLLENGDDQIITADSMLRSKKATPSRGRQPTSTVHDSAAMEADEEAFLSVSTDKDMKPCVRKGTTGAEFSPEVKAAVVAGRDIVFTKTHYSAFASGQQQLVQLLRGRFVTQLYVCGALTNISIYATALGAGQHGYDVTLVEDCCGFRSTMRHLNAVRQLYHLTGCDAISSESLLEQFQSPALAPAPQNPSTGLSPSISSISLELGGGSPPGASPAAAPRPTIPRPASPQPDRAERELTAPPRRTASNRSSPEGDTKRPLSDTAPLEADSDPSSSESESTHRPERKQVETQRNAHPPTTQRSELESTKGPTLPPGASSAKAEKPRVVNRVRQRVQRPGAHKKSSTPPSPESLAIRTKVSLDAPTPEVRASVTITTPITTTTTTATPITTATPTTTPTTPITTTTATAPPPAKSEPKSPPNMTDQQPTPVYGEPLCEGDTTVITNVLPPALAADAFERLLEEVSWAGMSHMGGEVPRRVAVQGVVADDGSMPVYRHPADESPPLLPFSPTVLQIKTEVEKHLGHPLNHVLIQHYRTGNDYISEHSDKTLDIVKGSFIANVSLGAERTMIFRTKRPPKDKHSSSSSSSNPPHPPPKDDDEPTPTPLKDKQQVEKEEEKEEPKRQTHRAPLPHNSLCRMGLATNTRWLHAIRQDKRADRDKTAPERAHHGARISLTFRHIGTFINAAAQDSEAALIWGQGATGKTRAEARAVVNGQTDEAVRMLQAFGAENNRAVFEWEGFYGGGFDVLHMGTPKRFFALASSSSSSSSSSASSEGVEEGVVNTTRVALALAELGVSCAKGSVEGRREVRFEDNDPGRAVVEGHASVLRYLDAVYGAGRRYDQMAPGEVARRFTRLERGLDLLGKWRAVLQEAGVEGQTRKTITTTKLLEKELADWEAWAKEAATAATTVTAAAPSDAEKSSASASASGIYIAGGNQPSPADFALWPVLHDMVRVCGEEVLGEHLRRYYTTFKGRSSVAKALGQLKAE
ncbi:hypothetical protein C8A00DRAFT_43104 [Chaetomidium leptoderma]|uniref:Fe2OG dioxygenase domain-containing protein n=1 Tax=Chaetomidium leptoderma TaxID=669021 RepID=A0AAN6VM10_9PEZI|nr:hypothetical protein C8A00DRAFT_43104 [Chaetomidium leptoderma]